MLKSRMISRGRAGGSGHEFIFGTIWTNDIFSIGDEAFSRHGNLTTSTDETLGVPVSALKGNEPGATSTSDGFATGSAPLGK